MKKIFAFLILFFITGVNAFAAINSTDTDKKAEITAETSFKNRLEMAKEEAKAEQHSDNENYSKAESGIVKKIEYDYTEKTDSPETISKQIVTLKITTGKFKGKEAVTDNMLTGNPAYEVFLKENDRVTIVVESNNPNPSSIDEVSVYVSDIKRVGAIYLYSFIFIAFLIGIGRMKGFYSLLSIIITVILVFAVFVPLVLFNISPIIAALIISVLSTVTTMYLVAGVNSKSNAATLGTVLSLIFASALALLAIKIAHLTGFMGEESLFLYMSRPDLSQEGILAASMMVAALGALMDVAISISSTINEIHVTDPRLSVFELFKSGMNVGRDIIGTMSNTLILVYLGSAMPLVLLGSNIDVAKFFNLNQVAGEILSALTGSISLLACVPLTAIMSAYLIKRKQSRLEKNALKNTAPLDITESNGAKESDCIESNDNKNSGCTEESVSKSESDSIEEE